jgi:release factor glutamine methyltransferase
VRIAQALAHARALGVARLDAQLLLAHLLQRDRAWLLAHDDAALEPALQADYTRRLERRAGGEPLAYVTGHARFCGLDLAVNPAVLIPRPETELLVEWALERLADAPSRDVVDLGTGSGAIALAIRHRAPTASVTATDASPAALAVACANAERLGLALECAHGDWWQALRGRRFGLAVSNPPYVAGADPHLDALGHEPRAALTPEGDGLAALAAIVDGAPAHLLPGAWLLLEHGHDQGDAVRVRLAQAGFVAPTTRADLAGLPRCTGARWPG